MLLWFSFDLSSRHTSKPDIPGSIKSKITRLGIVFSKAFKKDSPFEFLGNHLEIAYKRGELLGYKKAILELTKMETKIELELKKLENNLNKD